MKTALFTCLFCVSFLGLLAQKTNKKADPFVPMTADKWNYQAGKVEFTEYKNQKVMKLAPNSGPVLLKDVVFKNGTIEFDVQPILPGFAQSIYFHRQSEKEQEIVYLRLGTIGNKLANDAIQYTPYFDGVNMWDMYPQYQGPAPTKKDAWNHLKLVIAGKQMKVYMNQQKEPVLEIPKLEGNIGEGAIAFEGAAYIANVNIKANETEGLNPVEGIDLTNHDAGYLRKWAVTQPLSLPIGNEAYLVGQPQPEAYTDSISAEREGFINLTRKFGGNQERKVTWLKTKIKTKEAVKTSLQLGFSDEVWVFLNNQTVYVDKNLYLQNMRKYPNGRMSVDNATISLNLKQGDNELMIAVANDFYGWGIAARLASTENVTEVDRISDIIKLAREIANIDLNLYVGVYANAGMAFKLTFTKKDRTLIGQATGQDPITLQAAGNDTFRFDAAGVVLEFHPDEKKVVLRQGGEVIEFVKE